MLTPEQITEIRAKSGLKPLQQTKTEPTTKNAVGRFDYLKKSDENNGVLNELATRAKNVVNETKNNFQGIGENYDKNKNLPATVLSSSAILPKAIGDAIFEGIKMLMPDSSKEAVKKELATIMSNPTVQKEVIQPIMKWTNENPQKSRAVKDVVDIASILPAEKAVELGGKAIGKVAEGTGKIALKTGEGTKGLILKGLEKTSDAITPLEKGVENVLTKPTTKLEKLTEYENVAKEALSDYSKATPLELAGKKAGEALKTLQGKLKTYAENKNAITQELSNTNTGSIVDEAKNEMRSLLKDRTGLSFTEKGVFKNAPNRLSTVSDKADLELIKNIDFKLSHLSKNPTFQKVDDAIDWMQDLLYKRNSMTAVPVNKKVEGIIKNTVSNLNAKLKIIGGKDYSAFNSAYSHTKSTFDKLNKALGVEGNKGASLMKQLFSPSGTASRKLFADIKEKTGIDLVDEATLAKFVMENVGDVRQASLLEQVIKGAVPTSKRGLIELAAEKTINKLQNPINKAKRLIEKTKIKGNILKAKSNQRISDIIDDTIIQVGDNKNFIRIPKDLTSEQKSALLDEVKNISFSPNDAVHLSSAKYAERGLNELSLEEALKLSPNLKKTLDNIGYKLKQSKVILKPKK